MSKSMIQAFGLGQLATIQLSTRDRLKHTIAGCRDGKLYDSVGTDYGVFDVEAPDTEWITQADLELSRLTTSKIDKIKVLANAFYNEFGSSVSNVSTTTDDTIADDDADTNDVEEETENVECTEEVESESVELDLSGDVLKAIKKGKFKKAGKLIAKMADSGADVSKLQKKLDKAQ